MRRECSSTSTKTINDISEHTLFHTGTIAGIIYDRHGSYEWFYEVQYTFTDGSVIR
ncbi:hypothetical protein LCGC14_1933450, partial [marine sediment metagenome]